MFAAVVAVIGVLWKNNIAAPSLVGQAEPNETKVSCYKPGMLAELTVTRFQRVKNGDPVGLVLVTDPKILASSLSVIQAEIESLRISMQPMARQQHTAMEYTGLQLDWMRERAQLAMARVNLQLTEAELQRIEALYKDKIVSQRAYEQAKASHDKCKSEVDELSQIVEQQAKEFNQSQLTNTIGLAQINDQPLRAAIAVQESKLRLTEAELKIRTSRATCNIHDTKLESLLAQAIRAIRMYRNSFRAGPPTIIFTFDLERLVCRRLAEVVRKAERGPR